MTLPRIDVPTYRAMSTRQKKALWGANPIRGDVTIELDGIAPFVMFSENDDTVVKELWWTRFKGWERTSLHLWSALARSVPEGTVLDIGAYSGIYSILAALANPGHRVLAVDIQPRCISRIEVNRMRNGLDDITAIHAACVDTLGTVPYFFYEEPDILSSIAGVVPNPLNDQTGSAPAVTIDSIVGEGQQRAKVVLIKVDVEGAEERTLRGAQTVLAVDRPDVLVEINNRSAVGTVRRLFPRAYRCYSIDDDRPIVRRVGMMRPPFRSRNFLFSTRSPAEIERLADWSAVQ